ncbi:AsmA2 domain-containing protein YhdP [Lonsdalea quercina]|uniref:AsmA2 domain-containing protein YhdP n=1 Tax=Lonsdalea quercina TaxID=71657 RepID=UPI00397484B9
MRRLPGILLATGATLIVLVALAVSGLRLAMPHLDDFRPRLVAWAQSVSGIPIEVAGLHGSWEPFGPTLEINHIRIQHPDADWQSKRVTLALDVWQSLLHLRWQFRDLTFYQMQLDIKQPLDFSQKNNDSGWQANQVTDLFLRQLDHFDLRDSHITFLTPSGPRAELFIPQLTWLNGHNRHRAEGQISLSSFNGQHGVVQMRMDLQDDQGWLNDGTLYLQADDIDMKPWLSRWLRNNTGLENADFSLATWLHVRNGEIAGGDVLLNKGTAGWRDGKETHRISVDNMMLQASRQDNGWQLTIPTLKVATDGQAWPQAAISALWLPADKPVDGEALQGELRVRSGNLALERFTPLLPLLSSAMPELKTRWQALQPKGQLTSLALDIPLATPQDSRFQVGWQDVSWQPWQMLPGVDHFSGKVSGSVGSGQVHLQLKQSTLPYPGMFRAPLEMAKVEGNLHWRSDDQGWSLWSKGLDVQAKSLWANGDFDYHHPAQGEPQLNILAGLRLSDGAEAWRYYPEHFMGKSLVNYLSQAVQGGSVDNGTLIFSGNPSHFPFTHHDGQFQVWVPLKNAKFGFQPGWPALDSENITLNFLNNGLWMNAPQARLGNVKGRNIDAAIPNYQQELLLINGDLSGSGKDVSDYFMQTPLKSTLGTALQQLQIGGNVASTLHLSIPLNGKQVRASGEVTMNDNSLFIKPLGVTLRQLTGRFSYDNGNLKSEPLQASVFGQPLTASFSTEEQENAFQVNVDLQGSVQPARLPGLPADVVSALGGNATWKTQVGVTLPHKGGATYDVSAQADLKEVSSHLPSPLDKAAGKALPVQLSAKGDLRGFTVQGVLAKSQRFNSRWLLKKQSVALAQAVWQDGGKKVPALTGEDGITLHLPALDGERWLGLLSGAKSAAQGSGGGGFSLPARVTVTTPQLTLAGQQWRDLALSAYPTAGGTAVTARGREIDGRLEIPRTGVWRSDVRYLYYNPQWSGSAASKTSGNASAPFTITNETFAGWPTLQVNCTECWAMGQNLGRIQALLVPERNKISIRNGQVDDGKARLTIDGSWQQAEGGSRTSLKGVLSGDSLTESAEWLGIATPLRGESFNIDYDLYWHGEPWSPDVPTLSGILQTHLGKGEITSASSGSAGQLLRLISFDALLRKLQFDFSDTFNKGFYFDSIRSSAWIKSGVLHTDNLLVDGLEADIAMSGDVDLVKRQINMEATIAPELSGTVGVAAAFVVNPVVGAAVFAASKVLAPLWNKFSLIRYHISGSVDQPKIQEVLREKQKARAATSGQ